MRVERWLRISSRRRGYTAGQMDARTSGSPAAAPRMTPSLTGRPSAPMSSTATITCSSSGLRTPASTMVTVRSLPPSQRASSSSGLWVADRPMRCGGRVA